MPSCAQLLHHHLAVVFHLEKIAPVRDKQMEVLDPPGGTNVRCQLECIPGLISFFQYIQHKQPATEIGGKLISIDLITIGQHQKQA